MEGLLLQGAYPVQISSMGPSNNTCTPSKTQTSPKDNLFVT